MRNLWASVMALAISMLLGLSPALAPAGIDWESPAGVWLEETLRTRQDVVVWVDGLRYLGETRLCGEATYVRLSEYVQAMDDAAEYAFDGETGEASVTAAGVVLTVREGREYLCANGRYLWCREGILRKDGELLVPLRAVTAAFGGLVLWEEETFSAHVSRGGCPLASGEEFYREADVLWLSRIIQAESGGEPLLGKIAVGNVVLNRMRSEEFPDTIYDVIFDIRFGVQFSPVASGSVYRTPEEQSVIAAKLCLDGAEIDREMLYFINQKKSASTWMQTSCRFVMTIGNHDFYA